MAVLGIVFVIIAISITGMAIGVLFGRPPLSGTCGMKSCTITITCVGCQRRATLEQNR